MENTESDRIEITLHEANEGHGGLIEDGRENVKSRRKRRSVTLKAQLKNQESKRWFELCGSPVHNIMLSNSHFRSGVKQTKFVWRLELAKLSTVRTILCLLPVALPSKHI